MVLGFSLFAADIDTSGPLQDCCGCPEVAESGHCEWNAVTLTGRARRGRTTTRGSRRVSSSARDVRPERLEQLTMELFTHHDISGSGLLEESELILLNEEIARLHHGAGADIAAVQRKYRALFRDHLDPNGEPVPYKTFRQYARQVLDALDDDHEAQEMILEQFVAEAALARDTIAERERLQQRQLTRASPSPGGGAASCMPGVPWLAGGGGAMGSSVQQRPGGDAATYFRGSTACARLAVSPPTIVPTTRGKEAWVCEHQMLNVEAFDHRAGGSSGASAAVLPVLLQQRSWPGRSQPSARPVCTPNKVQQRSPPAPLSPCSPL